MSLNRILSILKHEQTSSGSMIYKQGLQFAIDTIEQSVEMQKQNAEKIARQKERRQIRRDLQNVRKNQLDKAAIDHDAIASHYRQLHVSDEDMYHVEAIAALPIDYGSHMQAVTDVENRIKNGGWFEP